MHLRLRAAYLRRFSAIVTILACAPAYAQAQAPAQSAETPSTGAEGVQDIIVTATRQSSNLQDVPMAVDVATGQKIERLSILNVSDVQQLSPGLQITNNTGRNNTATLRGISFDPDSGAFPAVEVYFNELSVNAQQAFTALYDIDQIEILRGPQGSTRGKTAPGGAITIRTRRPDLAKTTGYMQATATNLSAYNVQNAVSLPIKEDVLAFRAALLVDGNRANHVRNITNGDRSYSRTMSGRVSLAYQPTPDLRADLTYQYLDVDAKQYQQVVGAGNQPSLLDPTRSGPAIDADDRFAVSEGPARFRNSSHFVTLNVGLDLGSHELAFSGGYVSSRLIALRDFDVTNAVPGYNQAQATDTQYDGFTTELRLSSKNEGFFNYTLSAYRSAIAGPSHVDQQSATFFPSTLLGLPVPPTPVPPSTGLFLPLNVGIDVPVNNVTQSVAGSVSLQFTDKLHAEVAGRYNWLRSNFQTYLTVATPGLPLFGVPAGFLTGPNLASNTKAAYHFKALTGSGNLVYEATPDITAYLSYGRSFRLGPIAVGLTDPLSTDLTQTRNETSDSIEFGVKTRLFDRKVLFNAAVFYQWIHNYISRVPGVYYSVPQDGSITRFFDFNFNGDVRSKGAEVSISATPTPNWNMDVAASYVDARYQDASAPCNAFDASGQIVIPVGQETARCTRNDRIAEVPRFSLSANTEYRIPVGEGNAFVRGLMTYQPGFRSELAQYRYPSLTNVNLFLGFRTGTGWEVSGFVKNLLDQDRIRSISSANGVVGTTDPNFVFNSGYRTATLTNPREFGVLTTYSF